MQPGMGQQRDDLRPGLRVFSSGRYVVVYKQFDMGIEVARIIDGARDWEALLDQAGH